MSTNGEMRFRYGAGGLEVFNFLSRKWEKGDSDVFSNVIALLKKGLPDRPEFNDYVQYAVNRR